MKPREFWITTPDEDNVGNIYLSPDKQCVHVIEYSAYEKALQFIRDNYTDLPSTGQFYEARQILGFDEENDRKFRNKELFPWQK